jgi:uncharacterized cupredoxin-like copper-binding protein
MRARPILGAAALVLAASACGGGGSSDADVDVELRDFSIDMSTNSVTAGSVTFAATNDGPSVHEIEIFSVPDGVDGDALEVASSVADTDAAGLEVVDEVEEIVPGDAPSLTVDLDAGTYAVICNLPGHYQQGMHASFTVQ